MLGVTTNVSSLIAQNSLNTNSNALSLSLERLSTGLKINTGADGPAAFVISQEQQSQITGLQAAIQNTSEATSMVQTAAGGLGTINDLLNQMRSLALNSANSGVNDPNAQAANQAEIANALSTIDRIATNTQFGTKQILNGSAGLSGVSTNPNVAFINAEANVASAGSYGVQISTAATKATALTTTPSSGVLSQDETITVNGVNIGLTKGQNQSQVRDTINTYSGQTGVTASISTAGPQTFSSAALTTTATGAPPATATTLLSALTANTTPYDVGGGDTLTVSGIDGSAGAVAGTITLAGGANATVQDILDQLNGTNVGGNNGAATKIFTTATASLNADGQIVLTTPTGAAASLSITDTAGDTGVTNWTSLLGVGNTTTGGVLQLQSNLYGSAQTITATSNVAASDTSSGIGIGAGITGTGIDVAGTIGGFTATGQGDILTGNTGTGAQGITISAGGGVTGSLGNVNVTDNSLVFQIGANANQTVKVGIDNVGTAALGLGVAGNQFANLGQINIQTTSGAQDAIKIIDAATLQVSKLSGTLGAVQSQTLAETAANLQTTLTNTTSAESVIRDTDFAAETANYSKDQVLMQVGVSVLQNSNQLASLVTHLFQ